MTMAAAGVDASNVNADEIALLPLDSDGSARRIREGVRSRLGVDVAVIVTDTVGRPWRAGLVDVALGSAGIPPLRDLRGTIDTHGHHLAVTALAQVDELASASELVRGKLGRVAAAVIRGIPWHDDDRTAPGASSLVRPTDEDMFALGARDVVPAALSARPTRCAARPGQVAEALARVTPPSSVDVESSDETVTVAGRDPYELGMYVGQLVVALRAEGLAAVADRTTDGVLVRVCVAEPYQGIPR
jgi:coenzyme F420-0:L-glutamate ligase/coenzyme F420-1:gamma-L-glutamate ligase